MARPPDRPKAKNKEIEAQIRSALQNDNPALQKMLEYAAGFRDENFAPLPQGGGKRFRSELCLLLADGYGVHAETLQATAAIELFHNFTLIHDDLADRDQTRRGRPTLWKLAGENFALNTGDTLLLLATRALIRAEIPSAIQRMLIDAYIEACEGQHLDFELSRRALPEIRQDEYFLMIRKKTGALIGAAAMLPALIAEKSTAESELLREFGETLGTTYQLIDDYRSVWPERSSKDKDLYSDIREKKRTLPILMLFNAVSSEERSRLSELFETAMLTSKKEILEVLLMLQNTTVDADMRNIISEHKKKTNLLLERLEIPEKSRIALRDLLKTLIKI